MNKPRFLIDVDDVLADFAHPAANLISEITGTPWSFDDMEPNEWDMFVHLTPKQMDEMELRLKDPSWGASLKPTKGSQDFIKALRSICDVYVVTSALYWVPVRMEWLADHFGFEKKDLVFTRAKYLVSGDFFLDDHPDNVIDWQKNNPSGVGMFWTYVNNKHMMGYDDLRVYTWQMVLNKVRFPK